MKKSQKASKKNESAEKKAAELPDRPALPEEFLVVGLSASAGGVQALKEFFENVSANSGMAYIVILHLLPDRDDQLQSVLQTAARIPVTKVTERIRVRPNHVYVVPPNEHLEMSADEIVVSPNISIEARRAPVDSFFRTLAESHHTRAIAVVLSGTGANGSMGIERIKERGGAAFVQNPCEAEFSEIPRDSIATDLVDQILNVRDIPARLVAYKARRGKVEIPVVAEQRPEDTQQALREIFTHLRLRTGHDFSNYDRPTILRRIERRINFFDLPDISAYARFLGKDCDETNALLKDLLISVTNFFRDKEAFNYLEHSVLPSIFYGKRAEDQVRIWVEGCATGEEAYSIAMLCAERVRGLVDAPNVQIFATDIDEQAISTAREGLYTLNDAADVAPERLRRFFTQEGNSYRIRRELREMVLFANHNVIKDPPFSRLDAVTCRNMRIYLNPTARERVMETFHFALKPGGFLFLGDSESVDGASDLYAVVSEEHHVYQSRQVSNRIAYPASETPHRFADMSFAQLREAAPSAAIRARRATNAKIERPKTPPLERISFGDLHQRLLELYAPPSIVVNVEYDIVHLSENAGRFLQIAGGEPTKNLLKLIRPELRLELRAALYQAVQKQTNVEVGNLKIRIGERDETINIHARPVLASGDNSAFNEDSAAESEKPKVVTKTGVSPSRARGFILVIFEPSKNENSAVAASDAISTSQEPIARHLEEELLRTKSQLRRTIEQFEVQAEELKASNEELRSAAEELETTKKELQSVNQELITVNQKLKVKIEELSQSNDDFQNLIYSTDIATIFLDRRFRVHTFTPAASKIFNLIPADLGRPITDIAHRLEQNDLLADAERVLETLQTVERETRTSDGRTYLLRVLPYRTQENRISGVVASFIDITERKRAEETVRESEERLRLATEASEMATWEWNLVTGEVFWNARHFELFGMTPGTNPVKSDVFFKHVHPDDRTRIEKLLKKSIRQKTVFDADFRAVVEGDGVRWMSGYGRVVETARGGAPIRMSGVMFDITNRKRGEQALLESESRYRAIIGQSTSGIAELNLNGDHALVNPGFCEMLGYAEAELLGLNLRDVTHPDDYPLCLELFTETIKTGVPHVSEKRIICKNGSIIWITESLSRINDEQGDALRVAMIAIDITNRRRAEEALAESENRLKLLIESASDFAIYTLTPDNLIDSWNSGAEKVFGWTELEALGKSGEIIFTPEDRETGAPEQELKIALRDGRAPDERFHLRKDGSRFYASGVTTVMKSAGNVVQGFVKIARDMSEQLEAEKNVREKELLQKLVGAQEGERKRIARDLHDELGQQLIALRLKLDLAKQSCEDEEMSAKIDEIEQIARSIDNGVDFLAWELRPTALDHLGLVAALENYIKQWAHHSNIAAELFTSNLKKERFAPEVETNLYRIVQEALNNTHKHAKARNVAVMLEKRGDLIVLLIEDDGKGFNPTTKKSKSKGLGLVGMKERAQLVGGEIEIESAPGKGTTVFVRVPSAVVKKKPSDEK
jgi:two-component system CheB/CheR fusion protein